MQRKLGEHVESLSSDRFTQRYSGTAVGKICDTVERFCFIISVAGSSRPDTRCFFSVTEGERALIETRAEDISSPLFFFLNTVRNFQFSKHSILETVSEGIYVYIYIYIYIYKDLLHRNSLKYMWGYKIVPTTNLPHYHSKYSGELE